nr:hypothetical protein [Staphylococcus aureus]
MDRLRIGGNRNGIKKRGLNSSGGGNKIGWFRGKNVGRSDGGGMGLFGLDLVMEIKMKGRRNVGGVGGKVRIKICVGDVIILCGCSGG